MVYVSNTNPKSNPTPTPLHMAKILLIVWNVDPETCPTWQNLGYCTNLVYDG